MSESSLPLHFAPVAIIRRPSAAYCVVRRDVLFRRLGIVERPDELARSRLICLPLSNGDSSNQTRSQVRRQLVVRLVANDFRRAASVPSGKREATARCPYSGSSPYAALSISSPTG